ncbi:MAG TPA: pyridoxal-phosphate dependent enzyme [Ktedonobacteraceae bacterium]|nr:pyridoxal-phosphate dependent enzyme [Ktedonobacteraceae bacterium]
MNPESRSGMQALMENFSELYPEVRVTPLVRYQGKLSPVSELWLKDETQQIGGSFKFRGTYSRLLREPVGGLVVTASTGNHGIGVSLAAQKLGLRAYIFVPVHTSAVKLQKLTQLGARIEKIAGGYDECVQEALRFSSKTGAPYISSLDDPLVVHGHASLFFELRFQATLEPDRLFLPVGGGGLLAGCLECYQGTHMPIIGVELACVPSLKLALTSRERLLLPPATSCAEGMLVRQAGVLPFRLAQNYPDLSIDLVEEEEIQQTIRQLWENNTIRAEGSGASAVAAALRYLDEVPGKHVVAIISGGNIDEDSFQAFLSLP